MNNKLLEFDKLKEMLDRDKPRLNSETYDYLYGVINLNYSIVKDLITNEQREVMNNLQLYRSALIYNIQKLDRDYYNKQYLKDNLLFFRFCINKDDIPTITLFNRIASSSIISDPEINKKVTMTQLNLARIKEEYGLTDNQLDINKTLIKKMPGLIIKQDISKY